MISDGTKLIEMMCKFTAFVQMKDKRTDGLISFVDTNSFLGREEGYKVQIAEEARRELNYKNWTKQMIGTGEIAKHAISAMNVLDDSGKKQNLVFINQKYSFANCLNKERTEYNPEAEKVLYQIFCENDEQIAFENAIKVFGRKYDTIAFLFFVKDYKRFLPISPGNFDKSFASLNIDFKTSYQCSWDNYLQYNQYIREIQQIMNEILPLQSDAELVDAHSFIWVLHEDEFQKWIPDDETEKRIETYTEAFLQRTTDELPTKRLRQTPTFVRSAAVVNATLKRANGICQLCNHQAPFLNKNGKPYLEVHHVVWLSKQGKDSVENAVALCPNCHSKMHVLDDPEDVKKLLTIAKRNNI